MAQRIAASIAWALAWMVAVPCVAQTTAPAMPPESFRDDTQFTDSKSHWYDLDAPTSSDYELEEIFATHTAMFNVPLIDRPINSLLDAQRELQESIGLRIGLAYTQLYQTASGGAWGTAADVDLLFDWTLVGRGTNDTGRFFSVEERFGFGSENTPVQLSGELGSLASSGRPV